MSHFLRQQLDYSFDDNYSDIAWVSSRFPSPATRLFIQPHYWPIVIDGFPSRGSSNAEMYLCHDIFMLRTRMLGTQLINSSQISYCKMSFVLSSLFPQYMYLYIGWAYSLMYHGLHATILSLASFTSYNYFNKPRIRLYPDLIVMIDPKFQTLFSTKNEVDSEFTPACVSRLEFMVSRPEHFEYPLVICNANNFVYDTPLSRQLVPQSIDI